MSFVHLHTHTQYSLLEATCKIEDIVDLAIKYEMPAIAFTDYGNMFGAIESYFACRKKGIRPILGLEAFVTDNRLVKGEKTSHKMSDRQIVLLAKNFKGYQQLCQINTKGQQEGFYYRPRIDMEVLKEFSEHLICLTGGLKGVVPLKFIDQGSDVALAEIRSLKEIYKDNFFLEMQRTGNSSQWDKINEFLLKVSKELNIPVVATNDVHFIHKEDAIARDVLDCIRTNTTLHEASNHKTISDEYYFKSPEEMQKLFADIPEAISNTLEIAKKCQIEFQLKDEKGQPIYHLPGYPTQEGRGLLEEITVQAKQGLETRFAESTPTISNKDKYYDRLNHELEIIHSMGFSGYFLIVQDFIKWAKTQQIPVGPGRGSGAGSLVAYSLMITDLDPVKYHLIFERFLNPERISMPDFDIDFCQYRRQEVIEYVTQKYGKASVSQIITFGRLQARAAVRDVGRVLGMTFAEVDVIAKLIPDTLGITLDVAIEQEPRLRELMDSDPKAMQVLELARKIEGLNRHASIHAAGVVISDQPLVQLAPLYRGKEGENVIQFDMKSAEKIGLIKFDFLGLRTLTHIDKTIKLISSNRQKDISLNEISLSDKGIYELMSQGDTSGIFQFESTGITSLICKFNPKSFEDITAINALYRPGPMQMLDEFISRKHGRSKINYLFKELEPILKETYGIIVYQEQVQLIAAKIANYSLGEADILRRAMGKKKPEEMAQQKARFLKGAIEVNKYNSKKAEELFLLMAKFAEYGFNKSHAAAYCVLAAQTAWLKFHYPHEFYTALLSVEMPYPKKLVKYVRDVKSKGLDLKPPHVNFSDYEFSIQKEHIFFGLGAIKGVGKGVVEYIISARSKELFKDIKDFFSRVDSKVLNKKTIECLIQAGALDNLGASRSQIWHSYEKIIRLSEEDRKDQEIGQISLFKTSNQSDFVLPETEPWSQQECLKREKEVLGFFLSDHPLNSIQYLLDKFTTCNIGQLPERTNKQRVTVAGLVTHVRERLTKKATLMAFVTLEDLTDEIELIIFPDNYSKVRVVEDEVYIMTGVLEKTGESLKVLIDQVELLEDRMKSTKEICIFLQESECDRLKKLRSTFKKYPGHVQLSLQVYLSKGYIVNFSLPYQIEPTRKWMDDLYDLFKRPDVIWTAMHIKS